MSSIAPGGAVVPADLGAEQDELSLMIHGMSVPVACVGLTVVVQDRLVSAGHVPVAAEAVRATRIHHLCRDSGQARCQRSQRLRRSMHAQYRLLLIGSEIGFAGSPDDVE